MTSLLEAVRGIVEPGRVVSAPVVLKEEAAASRCGPISVGYTGESWALRLKSDDHLRVLTGNLPKEHSVRRLPDFIVFSAPRSPKGRPGDVELQVLVCELKSSAAGVEEALPQLQLGKLLTEYLVSVACHSQGRSKPPKLWCSGLIASPQFPPSLVAKGRTKPGRMELPFIRDDLSEMDIHQMPGSGDLRLESIFG